MKKIYAFQRKRKRPFLSRQLLLIMKLTAVFLMVVSLGVSAKSFSQTVTYKGKQVSLKTVFSAIEQQTGYVFFYNDAALSDSHPITVQLKDKSLTQALGLVLQNQELGYTIQGRTIFIRRIAKTDATFKETEKPAPLKGIVVDSANGQPLAGVTIQVKGSTIGTTTGADGEFSLDVPDDAVLVVSYLGYKAREIHVKKRSKIQIMLSATTTSLNQLVVVGYGKQKQSDLTGAISSISSKKIQQQAVSNIGQALEGQVAGVHITNNGWAPGQGTTIRIRGTRSITAGNDPLIVVDGVPWTSSLSDINPGNIASVQVLKDASATAIYGSRGANGVILITTKKGEPGKTKISYNAYVGVQTIMNKLDLMDAQQYIRYRKEAYLASGQDTSMTNVFTPSLLAGIKAGANIDWQDLVYLNAIQTSHVLTISGGSKQTQYSIAPSFYYQDGIQRNQNYKRYSLNFNLDHNIGRKFRTGVSAIITKSFQNQGSGSTQYTVLRIPPVVPAYDSAGHVIFNPAGNGSATSPVAEINNALQQQKRWRIFGRLYGQYNFTPWLSYRMNFGANVSLNNTGFYYGSNTLANLGGQETAGQSSNNQFHYTWDNIVNINPTFAGSHHFHITLLYSEESDRIEKNNTSVQGLPYSHQLYYNLGSASTVTGVGSNLTEWKLESYMARINYNYKGTYLLTLTAREDGSSRLAPDHKWALFPSAAFGWKISNEPFMNGLKKAIPELKLRVSYGSTGNTAVAPYQTGGGLSRTEYSFGPSSAFGYAPNQLPNQDLRWERTNQLDLGLNFVLFDGRINGDLDYYKEYTSDLLLNRNIPSSTGFNSILSNIGKTKNTGFNISLSTININTGSFKWTTDLNWSTNKNEIVQLYGNGTNDIANGWFLGQPIDVYYYYKFDGIWQSNQKDEAAKYDETPGMIRVVDQNNDGKINSADRIILGSPFPKWTGGITNTFEYKGLGLSFLITTVQGNMIYNHILFFNNTLKGIYNNLAISYWTPTNPSNKYPRPNVNMSHPLYYESQMYQNGNFVRVRNITLSYTFPPKIIRNIGIGSLRLYLKAQNPLLFTSKDFWGGYDPMGGTNDVAPSYRTFLFGVQMNL